MAPSAGPATRSRGHRVHALHPHLPFFGAPPSRPGSGYCPLHQRQSTWAPTSEGSVERVRPEAGRWDPQLLLDQGSRAWGAVDQAAVKPVIQAAG